MRSARLLILAGLVSSGLWAQQPVAAGPQVPSPSAALTLADTLQLARANSAQFHAALSEAALAKEDRLQARAALLPGISYNNQVLYTQPNETSSGKFIASNSVHEYVSQGNAHQVISLQQFADYRKAGAAEAVARARAEVAARGLVVTVVQDYYSLLAAQKKHGNAQAAADEAGSFLDLSQKLEKGGEVAHSDVIKAQLQSNDRKRDLRESQLDLLKAKLELAVLIFPSLKTDFVLADDLETAPGLPELAQVQQAAAEKNPDLRAALSALRMSHEEVLSSRAAHLPALSLDYFYGIDATHFAVRTDGVRNLGYAATATLNIPVFSWGATQSKVRQSLIRESLAKVELSTAQRQVLANVQTMYDEADAAATELASLRQSMELATESLRLTTLRYRAGESTVLEVVDAQNTLNTARNAYASGSVRYRVALANLQTLTGTL
jgi:outer membrane protein TolC